MDLPFRFCKIERQYERQHERQHETPRGQELLGHIIKEWQIKPPNIIAHEKGFQFYAQPQTGLYSLYIARLSCLRLNAAPSAGILFVLFLFLSLLGN